VPLIDRIAPLLREPLVHFLIAGALIFALFGRGAGDPADRSIIVTEAQVRGLTAQWEQTWQRQPTSAEIDGLIRDYIKDEVYYREAIRLGLDQDDIIMRRRMRSKMEFLVAAQSENEAPTEAELQAWFERNKAKYTTGATLSFDQVFVDGNHAATASILARLKQGADPVTLGEPLLVPAKLDMIQAQEVDRQFGDGFAKQVAQQVAQQWVGPVESGFGQHIVRLRKLAPGAVPPLAQVRQAVENDWRETNRKVREAKAYQALLDGYTIRIAKP
jgi:peptidyl-prolyl cis-trans isomerase C